MLNWQEHAKYLVQMDYSKKKRESKWVVSCSICQNERTISYCHAYNIIKNIYTRDCKSCQIKAGIIVVNKNGLACGRYYPRKTKADKSKNKRMLEIINTFGMIFTPEIKDKQRKAKLGKFKELANNYQGGKVNERKTLMSRDEYKSLRKQCFSRDNYTCQICLIRGGKLEMDHIKEWSNYPEARFDINNVRTLCSCCHKKTDNYGTKAIRKRAA